ERVRATKARGGRVIAVGTTVVRALESSVDANGDVVASRGWTDIIVTPERGVRIVDGLLTGLHEPRATHLQMLEAIAGREGFEKAYAEALGGGYLWHECGDVHLIAWLAVRRWPLTDATPPSLNSRPTANGQPPTTSITVRTCAVPRSSSSSAALIAPASSGTRRVMAAERSRPRDISSTSSSRVWSEQP